MLGRICEIVIPRKSIESELRYDGCADEVNWLAVRGHEGLTLHLFFLDCTVCNYFMQ